MHLRELKQKSMAELVSMARELTLDGVAGMRKQDAIFAILTHVAAKDGDIYGEGGLECLPDGFGFLRAPDSNYLAGPDDVYVSPSQVRRFNLRTGDRVQGTIRPPKESERYFALIKVDKINAEAPEIARDKILFDNLTPLYPQKDERPEEVTDMQRTVPLNVIDSMEFLLDKLARTESNREFLESMNQ